jgi:DNA-binding LacI/PurR family transcriptional regulator
MPTLMDVARAAKVSRSTVSNVFNNPERVRPAVRARVEAAARKLGFAGPDPKGRLLQAGKVNAIGVISVGETGIRSMFTGYFPRFLAGVADVCDDRGVNLSLVSGVDGDRGRGIRDALVDGFILSEIHEDALVDLLRRRGVPFVMIDVEGEPGIASVRADARSGCRDAARHLTALGHRDFAIMSFRRDLGPAVVHAPRARRPAAVAGMALDREKLAGYAEALAEAGISIARVPIVQATPWDATAAALLLDAAPAATAILSMSDMQAIRIMDEAERRGRRVPADLSVVGYNDIPEAALATPPLTTIDGQGFEKGRTAARLVFDGGAEHALLPARLVVRASTGPAPARR